MTRMVLVLRPEPGASATAGRAAAMGLPVAVRPLFGMHAVAWTAGDVSQYDAVLLTSANAVRFAGSGLTAYLGLPVFAVGEATAEAAREAGFSTVFGGESDAAGLIAQMGQSEATHCKSVLHLAGRDRTTTGAALFRIDTVTVYASDPLPPPDVPDGAVALLHSTRAALRFATIVTEKDSIAIVAISRAVANAAGPGWQSVAVAEKPHEAAMLALAASLCKTGED